MRKAVIYARFSDRRDNDDLDRMVRELQAFAASKGILVADVIKEDDTSAWWGSGPRKGRWPEVYEGLASGRWDALLVRSLDRSARDIIETVNLVRLYGRLGFAFYALNGDSLDDFRSATIKGLVADWESTEKSHRLKLKWADKASKGEYHPGRWRPFGYQYVKEPLGRISGLVIDPHEAEIVREIARRVIAGESLHFLALDLERRGVPTVSGGPWQRLAVKRILKPLVAGLVPHNGEELPSNHPAILDMDTYLQAKAAVNPSSPSTGWVGHNARKHLLAGMLVCGRCGVILQCNGRIYQCVTKNTHNGVRGCGKLGRSKIRLENLVSELIIAYLEKQDLEAEEMINDDWSPAIEAARNEVDAINAAYQDGAITASDWLRGLKTARKRLAEAEAGRSEALRKAVGQASRSLAGEGARERWEALNLSQRRAILSELIEAIVVKPVGRGYRFDPSYCEVVWRSPVLS